MLDVNGVRIRPAVPADAGAVAAVHATNWRRHYRGAYSDSFLDGDLAADRSALWSRRLNQPSGASTLVAEDGSGVVGFVHVVFDDSDTWGSLVDNLHVVSGRRRSGVGTALLSRAAHLAAAEATSRRIHLWVLEQNTDAQAFYRACGGAVVEKAAVEPPGGVASRLEGDPVKLRIAWPTLEVLIGHGQAPT